MPPTRSSDLERRMQLQEKAKIRVYYPDGVFRGGLLKMWRLSRVHQRVWDGPIHPHEREFLWEVSPGEWYQLFLASDPEISGPPDGSDPFDATSRAVALEPPDVIRWLRNHGFEPPQDLEPVVLAAVPPSPRETTQTGFLTAPEIARRHRVKLEPLRKRLERWRAAHLDDDTWIEIADRKQRRPKYLFKVEAVLPIVNALQQGSRTPRRPS